MLSRPPDQTASDYERRIGHLENVVHILLARATTYPSPSKSLAPLVGSFRYSLKRGLEPILSGKAAASLTPNRRIGQAIASQQQADITCGPSPRSIRSSTLALLPTRSLTTSTPLAAPSRSIIELSPPSSPHPSPPSIDNRPDFSSVSLTDTRAAASLPLSANQPDVASVSLTNTRTVTPWIANRLDIATVSLSNTRADLSSIPPPPSLPQPKAAARPSITPSSSPSLLTEFSPRIQKKKNTRSLSHSSDRLPFSIAASAAELQNTESTLSLTNDPANFTALKSPPSPSPVISCNHMALTPDSAPPKNLNPSTTLSQDFPTTPTASTTTTQTSLTPNQKMTHPPPFSHPSSDSAPTDHHPMFSPKLSSIVTPPELATAPLAPPESFESKSALSSTTNCSSSLICPTAQNCPENLEVAAVGGIEILDNDDIDSIEAQIAPEYSQATLDYYNDIQEYLQQANADETETKKKKKKKKKKKANPTSTADNPVLFYV
ncbi:hypothetical protein PGT21_013196 [Puccinia graminis f. sp. tritici]|uniref:Uncharacterized protein n=1 Tax=Puccinia graminis f. sp. tritici TaxID=56615 RepID=A0A5B0NGX8_PUCGR|nr:hypothetical protein PGT21_013196 [Puccinia graminis f. sp. tritici]KAA1088043.1 hypothetical protein PGTUg99_022873 [Puccinia graminis f. sp. tritici]